MPYHLLTVDHAHAVAGGVQLAPTVRLQRLAADAPGAMKPMQGGAVELRLPDGQIRRAAIRLFGIDGWQKDGYFYTASNPADPELTLSLQDVEPADVPVGTQVWLPERDPGSSPDSGSCSYCQMIQATHSGAV